MAWIAGAAALASAAAGAYGAYKSGEAMEDANQTNRESNQVNADIAKQNQLLDAINQYRNIQQQALDNGRYDQAFDAEQKQRQLINALSTATQTDADGNSTVYDPTTNTWRVVSTGQGALNRDRRRAGQEDEYRRSLVGQNVDNEAARAQANAGIQTRGQERALADALLRNYTNNQGRTPQQMEAAGIERNVANAMDPLRKTAADAALVGYRQGSSGSDALLGTLARQGQAGTRSAIANARFDAPGQSLNERDMAAKSILGPATTLSSRGNAPGGMPSPTYSGDASANLMATLARVNPAGTGSQLNPRTTASPLGQRGAGLDTNFRPLNAQGTMAAGFAESMKGLTNPALTSLLTRKPEQQSPWDNTTTYEPWSGDAAMSGWG